MNIDLVDKLKNVHNDTEILIWIKLGFSWKRTLTPKQYCVVYLKIIENLEISQIADIMGLRASTVRQHWRNSIIKARKLL